MRLVEFERRITDAAEALNLCALSIKVDESFDAERNLLQALADLEGCRQFASEWADEQEAEIAKAEEAKGYEVIND